MARSGRLFTKTTTIGRAFSAWLVVFALLVQALAPLSTAWAHDAQTDGQLQVICTASGVQTIVIGPDGAPIKPADTKTCPFCVVHIVPGVFSAQEPVLAAFVAIAGNDFSQPSSFSQSSVWRGSLQPPRGPPASA